MIVVIVTDHSKQVLAFSYISYALGRRDYAINPTYKV